MQQSENGAAAAVELSVVIATHNRREQLETCLTSLIEQSAAPGSFDVIVAADGCVDGTAEMASSLDAPYEVKVLELDHSGQPGAQNAAIEAAGGSACLFLDDDVIASPDLVAAHIEAHRSNPETIGVGSLIQRSANDESWFAEAYAHGLSEHYAGLAESGPGWQDCYGANFSAPRRRLIEAGGIATDLDVAYDLEVALRLCRMGCEPRYLPRALAVHNDEKSARDLLRDARRQGETHVELARRYTGVDGTLLAWNAAAGTKQLILRRALLAARVPAAPLAAAGYLLPGRGRKMIWLHFVRGVAFWSGVRRAATREEWRQITQPVDPSGPVMQALPIALSLLESATVAPL